MTFRFASRDDLPFLAGWNHQLIRDEGHRNAMTVPQLTDRLREWLATGYRAVLFELDGAPVAYALYREQGNEIHLRHLFVIRERRRQGIGRQAMRMLLERIWAKDKRLTVGVLCGNKPAIAFWKAVGFTEYSLTLEIMPRK